MGGGSGDSHGAHGGHGKAASAYPDRFPNSCEFRIPGNNTKLLHRFSVSHEEISSNPFQTGVHIKSMVYPK